MAQAESNDLNGKLDDAIDHLVIQLRAYVEPIQSDQKAIGRRWDPPPPGEGVLVFDTETTVDPSQRLRFGAYQLRLRGHLVERGVFYNEDATVFPASDLEVLKTAIQAEQSSGNGERTRCITRGEFSELLFDWSQAGTTIVGFNLPFDLSRLAISHAPARRSMKGGFSFTLSTDNARPNVRVKHLSQRSQFIELAGDEANGGRRTSKGRKIPVDRGFFVDVKTLAAALTSQSHSLKSLSTSLKTPMAKQPDAEHGKPLTRDYLTYAMADVQVTWECFSILAERYAKYQLPSTGLHQLFSEASLGKAFLKEMGIKPWRIVQPQFPATTVGKIMSSYFGGRAEVHIRRTPVPVIHCDFLSMYPTVCTLMHLWKFVIATGMTESDDTDAVRHFVENCNIVDLQNPAVWRQLSVLVKVQPSDDIFPVRARYRPEGERGDVGGDDVASATIGLNRLTSETALWFTLADVLTSKLLRGKSPTILQAIRFQAMEPQSGLRTVKLGNVEIDPIEGDFYRDLINQRRVVQAKADAASGEPKASLLGEQQALKILANATSYGIFVELNVDELDTRASSLCHTGAERPHRIETNRRERPGQFFHPLLGTLITGAARLMLALAEHLTIAQGLDWAFCDTDSLAIANTSGFDHDTFIHKVEHIRAWFEPLNPYDVKGSILQLEKTNFPKDGPRYLTQLEPLHCLAISAKRYVLYNRTDDGELVLRKASAHGLGHLLPPYPDPHKETRLRAMGVELWQEDLWRIVTETAEGDRPDEVDYSVLNGFDQPAASRYAATKPGLLKWFDRYNSGVDPSRRVGPFNFLLIFQAKSQMEMAAVDPDALMLPAWHRRRPRPAAPYAETALKAAQLAFDRDDPEGSAIPMAWLKTQARSLARYHMHPETKFRGGDFDERGVLQRRHVQVLAIQPIGKEADNLEQRELIDDADGSLEYMLSRTDRQKLMKAIGSAVRVCSVRRLTKLAGVSHHTLTQVQAGAGIDAALMKVAAVAERLMVQHQKEVAEDNALLAFLSNRVEKFGRSAVARELSCDPSYLGRILAGRKLIGSSLRAKLMKLMRS